MIVKFKKGSALLLAFLIMTAILSSVLYISRLSLRQIKESKSTDNSNIAFYAAESGNEQAIYYIRKTDRNFEDLNISSIKPVFFDNLNTDASIIRSVDNKTMNINIGIKKNQFYQFDLYNPESLGSASNLSYLEMNWKDNCSTEEYPHSSWIELTENVWNGDDSGNINWGSESSRHIFKSLLNTPPYVGTASITEVGGSKFDASKVYQFRVKALFCDIYDLQIKAFNENDEQLSFTNIYVIKTVGQYPGNSSIGNKQALSVSLRNFDPLSGLFDYVIFSEQSLVKDF